MSAQILSTTRDDTLPDANILQNCVNEILDQAKRRGAGAAEAGVSIEIGYEVTARLGEIETVQHHRDRGLGITVYVGQRKGSASSSDLSTASITQTVDAALAIARHTGEDPCAGLPEPQHLSTNPPELDLYHPWDLDVERAGQIALAAEAAARGVDKRITNSEGATVSSHAGLRVYGNSHGFCRGFPSSNHSVSCAVIGEAAGAMQRDYWYSVARDPSELETPEFIGREAALRTVKRLGARTLPTGKYPVLYVPEVAVGLFGHFVGAIRGASQYRRASFLLDQCGQQIFPPWLSIDEAPHLLKGLASAPFDQEGVVTAARTVVQDGVLQGYVLDSYGARKLGLKTTGNAGGVHNLIVRPGAQDFTDLVRDMGRGLIVTELMGQGVNSITGDYSRGAAGFWVEGGEIHYPVEEITVAGNLRTMFQRIAAVGRDVETRRAIRTGSVLIEEMTVAGE